MIVQIPYRGLIPGLMKRGPIARIDLEPAVILELKTRGVPVFGENGGPLVLDCTFDKDQEKITKASMLEVTGFAPKSDPIEGPGVTKGAIDVKAVGFETPLPPEVTEVFKDHMETMATGDPNEEKLTEDIAAAIEVTAAPVGTENPPETMTESEMAAAMEADEAPADPKDPYAGMSKNQIKKAKRREAAAAAAAASTDESPATTPLGIESDVAAEAEGVQKNDG